VTIGVRDGMHGGFDVIGADRLHQKASIRDGLLVFAVELHFHFATGRTHDSTGTSAAVRAKSGMLLEFFFSYSFLVDVGIV